jgi:hypothetical protein
MAFSFGPISYILPHDIRSSATATLLEIDEMNQQKHASLLHP